MCVDYKTYCIFSEVPVDECIYCLGKACNKHNDHLDHLNEDKDFVDCGCDWNERHDGFYKIFNFY